MKISFSLGLICLSIAINIYSMNEEVISRKTEIDNKTLIESINQTLSNNHITPDLKKIITQYVGNTITTSQPNQLVNDSHTRDVPALAFSPDGKALA